MIKINKSIEKLDDLAKKHLAIINGAPFSLKGKLEDKLNEALTAAESTFYIALYFYLSEIIIGRPDELEQLRLDLSPLYEEVLNSRIIGKAGQEKKKIKKALNNEVLSVFDYSAFSKSHFAYELTINLGVNVCLYCNRQYTFTLDTKTGKTRPQFDHFYDKASYPYFAISFFNLIPSCSICNCSLKGSETFSFPDNFHPYVDDSEGVLSFNIDVTAVEFVDGKKEDFSIVIRQTDRTVVAEEFKRAKLNADVFKIEDLCNMHKDYVIELIKKAYYYNDEKIKQFVNFKTATGNSLFDNKVEVMESIVGNYVRTEKLGSRVLAKLTRDIADQLGLMKLIK